MDNAIKIAVGLGGGLSSFLFGGWSALLQTLVLFIVLDYIFAIIVAFTHGELNSKKGFNTLTITPENTFDTKIRFKPRYR